MTPFEDKPICAGQPLHDDNMIRVWFDHHELGRVMLCLNRDNATKLADMIYEQSGEFDELTITPPEAA